MKTPKEEAKELLGKYLNIEFGLLTDNQAKQCALFCVDEKIKTVQELCELKNGMSEDELAFIGELLEVKQEIEKL